MKHCVGRLIRRQESDALKCTCVGGTQRLPATKWMPTWTRECSLRRHSGARDERPDGIVELNPVDANRHCGV
jgi:hypothetical protein